MKLLHYSSKPLGTILSKTPRLDKHRLEEYDKPRGLWVSVGTAWKDWCVAEEYSPHRLNYVHEITLADDAKILRIGSINELDDFTANFCEDKHRPGDGGLTFLRRSVIRWPEVASRFGGIIIAPYLHERRLYYSWYYGWDCASGCIWDARAIASAVLVNQPLDTPPAVE